MDTQIPDEQLFNLVMESLDNKTGDDTARLYDIVLTFSEAERAIYIISFFDADVNNGGFSQYYLNFGGQFSHLLPDALRLIGAPQFAELMEKANQVYEYQYQTITRYMDGTAEGFEKSYENNPLNALDEEYYKLSEGKDLFQFQVDFIRNNKELFGIR